MNFGIFIIYLCTITGLIFINKIRPKFYSIIVVLLILTSCNETWVSVINKGLNGVFYYNIFSIVEITCWCYIFYKINHLKKKGWHFFFIFSIIIFSIVEIIFRKGFHTYSYRLFSIFTIVTCLQYFYQLVEIEKKIVLWKDGTFWIMASLLIFHFVFFFYLTAIDIKEFRSAKDTLAAFRTVISIVNIIYYLMLSIGFLCLSFFRQ